MSITRSACILARLSVRNSAPVEHCVTERIMSDIERTAYTGIYICNRYMQFFFTIHTVTAVLFYNSYCHRALCRQMTVSISGSYHVYLSFLFLPEGPVLRPGFLISPGLLRSSDPVDDCERLLLAALFLRASLFLLSSSSCASCF